MCRSCAGRLGGEASRTPAAIQPRLVAELNPLQRRLSNRMGYCKCGVAHCYDPLRLSLRSLDLSPGGRSHPLVILHLGGHCSKVGMHTHKSVRRAVASFVK